MTFTRWIRYFRILKTSRTRIYRYIFDQWRESIKETITSVRYYEMKLLARVFFSGGWIQGVVFAIWNY